MTILSHAQNLEDVMLWRALRHVEDGFYIDAGAFRPDADSVTRLFSDCGWRGINIEPDPEGAARFATERPRDVNLAIAVSDHEGTLTLQRIAGTGLSTVDGAIAERHRAQGWVSAPLEVPCRPLAAMWDAHVPQGQPVHFLKVDVEGHEAEALAGLDWTRQRPWILVIEATEPNTQIPSHGAWHGGLAAAGYDLVYWDGLNRFYLAREQAGLAPHFSCPPNVFDDFVRSGESHLVTLASEWRAARRSLASAAGERDQLKARLAAAEAALAQADAARAQAEESLARAEDTRTKAEAARAALERRLEEIPAAREALARSTAQGAAMEQRLAAQAAAQHALAEAHGRLAADHAHACAEAEAAMALRDYLMTRAPWEALLFRSNGKPKRLVRALLFHAGGKPRGLFRRLVLHRDGRPRRPFALWMASPANGARRDPPSLAPPAPERAPRPAAEPQPAPPPLSPRSRLFLGRLRSAQARHGGL